MLALTQHIGFGGRRRNSPPPSFSNTLSISNGVFGTYIGRAQGVGTSKRTMTLSAFIKTPADLTDTAISVFNVDEIDFVIFSPDGIEVKIPYPDAVKTTGFTPATSTWYHIFILIDTTQATATNRVKIFVDAVDMTDTAGSVYPAQNSDTVWGDDSAFEYQLAIYVGAVQGGGVWLVDEIAKFDGQIYAASDVADGSNKPKDISGLSFGADGYWLRFETGLAASIGADSSGNGNDFTDVGGVPFVDGDFSAVVP